MRYIERYKNSSYPMPEELNPVKKGMDYCINKAEAIYSLYVKDKTGIYYSSANNSFDTLRDYGRGAQVSEKYKKYFMGERTAEDLAAGVVYDDVDGIGGWTQTPTGKRKGFMNVLWDVISIAPKIRSALIGKFQQAEYDVTANAINEFAVAEKDKKKFEAWFMKQNKGKIAQLRQMVGVPMPEPDFEPESKEELEQYSDFGGFKAEYEVAAEMLTQHTLSISDWDGIKDNMMTDAIDLGIYGDKEYFDEEENKYKIRYCDPKNLVIQYSKYPDFRDSEFAGEFVDYTISQLRYYLRNEGVSEEKIADIAKSYSDYGGNPSTAEWEDYKKQSEVDGCWGYDFYKVCVFEAEWIETDAKQYLIRTNSQGRKKVIEQEYGEKNKESEKNTVKVETDRYRYTCSWIIGTDIAYNFGKAFDILRPARRSVALSYQIYKLNGKSITEQLIPLYDNFMILWVKYQNALATAVPKGYFINYDSIKNMTRGGKETGDGEEIFFKRFLETGIGVFKETNAMNVRNTTIRPVIELAGGMGSVFEEIRQGFMMNISLVESVTGITPLSLGTVDPQAPVGTSEIGVSTTNDTLRPMLKGYLNIKERTAEDIVLWIQLKVKTDDDVLKGYEEVIGKRAMNALKQAEKNSVSYGITLDARPTDFEKKRILDAAEISLANGRDGKPGINYADYFAILRILTTGGSYKLAQMVLGSRIEKAKREADQRAKENLQMQTQGNIAQKKADLQSKLIIIDAEKKSAIEQEYAKAVFEVAIKNPNKQMMDKEMMEIQQIYDMLLTKISQQQQQTQPTNAPQ